MLRARPVLPITLVVAVVLGVAAAPGAAATPCKAGQGRLVLQGKARCVAPGALLPAPTPGEKSAAHWTRFGIDRQLPAALQKRLAPRRWRKAPAPKVAAMAKRLRARVGPFAAGLESRATAPFTARLRAITLSEGPTTVTQTADGVSVKGSVTATDSVDGTSATLDLGGKATAEGRLDLDIGVTIRDRDKGSSSSTSFAMPIFRKDVVAEVCPSATGVIRRVAKFDFRRTTREQRTMVGLDYRNESTKASSTVTMTGQVDRGAVLRSMEYAVSYDFDWAFAASALRGVGRGNVQLQLKATASGAVDGPTGARTGGATTITGSFRDIALSAKQERAAFAKTIADPDLRAKILKVVSDLVDTERQALKKAEAAWQRPGACATMALDPASGTLEDGLDMDVRGTVRAKDGAQAEADWTLAARTRGQVDTLPGSSGASTPITLSMVGEAPPSGTRTVDVLLRATSPAGVAQAPWTAEGVRRRLFFRVVGGSGAMTVRGSLTNAGCITDQTGPVGPWTYAFARSTGAPDGSVAIDESGGLGSVRGTGDTTRQAWTWRKTCPPAAPSTQSRVATTVSGRFGPSVVFIGVPGDPTRIDVLWGEFSPVIFQYDVDGPDCGPVPGELAMYGARIPLSTLEQAAPFTLSIDTDWVVDTVRPGLGRTRCTGDTQQSLTLQRVAADGSAL